MTLLEAALAGLFVVLAASAGMALVAVRHRRHLERLGRRMDQLEERLAKTATEEPSRDDTPTQSEAALNPELSSDALAGWTSHVGRVLAEASQPSNLADQAVVAIYRRLDEAIRPADLADDLAVSLRTLERGISRFLECSPSDLILTVKMREAKRMLASGQFLVGHVAHRLAFADAAHFSRRYRRFHRCPPSEHLAPEKSVN